MTIRTRLLKLPNVHLAQIKEITVFVSASPHFEVWHNQQDLFSEGEG